jgi:hypothetical protein
MFVCQSGKVAEKNRKQRLPRLAAIDCRSRAERFAYLRVAQTYMLISMPTCTSTIFGVFHVIRLSQVFAQVFGATLAPTSG